MKRKKKRKKGSGGYREGAGRKEREKTVVIRVPQSIAPQVKEMARIAREEWAKINIKES